MPSHRDMSQPKNSYTNPAFCQQSEFYSVRCKSPNRSIRQSPVGAQTVHLLDTSIRSIQNEPLPPHPTDNDPEGCHYDEEQEFYEEMILDHSGAVQEKKFVVVHNDNRSTTSYNLQNGNKSRYEYIPMHDQDTSKSANFNIVKYHEEVDASTGRVHRYAVIPSDEEEELKEEEMSSKRYALVPVEDIRSSCRYAVVTQEKVIPKPRYEFLDGISSSPATSPTKKQIVQRQQQTPQSQRQNNTGRIPPNPVATQKLHELLTTPRKKPLMVSNIGGTPQSPVSPIQRPNKQQPAVCGPTPRAQQKLNYAIGTRHPQENNKRHTAIVTPMCSSPIYCETTFDKNDSWSSAKVQKHPAHATLTIAAFMMILCGGVTTGLCIYMISFMGRLYFLDFGILSGFTCFLLGLLGFRSRNVYWLPNRNYLSGYFVLSIFSLLTCAGLLILLFVRPRPGSPLADMTSGAVCGISGLSLLLASSGIVASYCCKVPPPDNRVTHSAPGFHI